MTNMPKLHFSIALCFLFCDVVYNQVAMNDDGNKDKNMCNTTSSGETGSIQYNTGSGIGVPNVDDICDLNIAVNATELQNSTGILLVANHFFLLNNDHVKIKGFVNNTLVELPYTLNGTREPFAIFLNGFTNVTVTLTLHKIAKPEDLGVFQMQYNTMGCIYRPSMSSETGSLEFPIYTTQTASFNCEFKFNPSAKDINFLHVTFDEFNLQNPKDLLSVEGSKTDGKFTGANGPVELLSDGLTLGLTVTNTSITDTIKLRYDYTTAACSDVIKLDEPKTIASPPTNDKNFLVSQKFDCLYFVQGQNDTIINFDLKSVTLTSASDQIIILDGHNQSSPLIAQITQSNLESWKKNFLQTSGQFAWVAINTPSAKKDFKVEITATQRSTGGYNSKPGIIVRDIKDDGVFLFKFEEGKQVKISFNPTGNVIPPSGMIKFYKNFDKTEDPIAVYKASDILHSVISMDHFMSVQLVSFATGKINMSVDAQEPGCFVTGSGSAGAYSLRGNCNQECYWKIPPIVNSTDDLLIHFSSINLEAEDVLEINKLDSKETLVLEVSGPLTVMPDLIIPASDGVILNIIRKNCSANSVAIQASFAVKSACNNQFNTKGGDSLRLASPNSPNGYPLNSNCSSKVTTNNNSSLHLSFESLGLAMPGHELKIYSVETVKNVTNMTLLATFNSSNTELPNDILLVRKDLYLTFTSTLLNKTAATKTGSGFSINVLTLDGGDIVNAKSGSATTPEYPTKVKGSTYAWVVEVPALNTTDVQNIINFNFGNLTKEEEEDLEKYVTVFDGASIRSQRLTNFTYEELLSRTNTLIVLYKHENMSQDGPSMRLEFKAHACNSSLMCNNKICMHDDWKCDGVNQCGDWSDERDCEGTLPGPTPPVPPTPAPTPEKGTSTTALTLGILAALIIGILLGVAAPAAYRRFAGTRFSTYSTFSNTPE